MTVNITDGAGAFAPGARFYRAVRLSVVNYRETHHLRTGDCSPPGRATRVLAMITSHSAGLSRVRNEIATRPQEAGIVLFGAESQPPMPATRVIRVLVGSTVAFPAALLVLMLLTLAIVVEAINQTLDRRKIGQAHSDRSRSSPSSAPPPDAPDVSR